VRSKIIERNNPSVIQKLKFKKKIVGGKGKSTAVKVVTLSCLSHDNFQLFMHLKKHVAGQMLRGKEEVTNEGTGWLRAQAAEFCHIGIQNLVPRLNRFLGKDGGYVEKQLKLCFKIFSLYFF
jgi:hypothetical protein